MKTMILKLADDKAYRFSTFTMRQQMALRTEQEKYMSLEEDINKAQYEVDENGKLKRNEKGIYIPKTEMTNEDRKKLLDITEEMTNLLMEIFRMAISRKHPEFKIIEDKEKNKEISERVLDLVDLEDLRDIFHFAVNGTPPIRDTDEYDFTKLMEEVEKDDG